MVHRNWIISLLLRCGSILSMLEQKTYVDYIKGNGYRPACPEIDIPKINRLCRDGQTEFKFYLNPHNLFWFCDNSWIKHQENYNPELLSELRTLTIRDFKLFQLDI